MIELRNVSKSFGDKEVTKNFSTLFESGKTNLVIGESGSGKTVLIKLIVGLLLPDSGDIVYDDVVFNRLPFEEKKEIRKQIGMLFQGGALFDSATIEENVRFPLNMFTNMSSAEKRSRVDFCLDRVNLSAAHKLYPAEISGGMKKRAAIARAIALNPKYLFCDEPNSGLDPQTSILIDDLIKEITIEYNITTIVNTHDMNSVLSIGDKVIFVYEGEKGWEGTKEDILHTRNEALNSFVFATNMGKKLKSLLGSTTPNPT